MSLSLDGLTIFLRILAAWDLTYAQKVVSVNADPP